MGIDLVGSTNQRNAKGSSLCLKSGKQSGPPVQVAGLFHGDAESFFLPDEDDSLAAPGEAGVEQIPLEHHEMLHCQRDDDSGELTALAFVNGYGVGEAEFVEIASFVGDPTVFIVTDMHAERVGFDFADETDVAVEHFLFVVVADLNNLVALAEGLTESFDLHFEFARWIQGFLEQEIQLLSAKRAAVHRS